MQRVHFRVTDLETIGFLDEAPQSVRDDPVQGIVEIGYTDVTLDFRDDGVLAASKIDIPGSLLFKPPGGIPPVSTAIHHISPRMVSEMPACRSNDVQLVANGVPEPFALVAHNSAFEKEWMGQYIPDARWICTEKVARRLHPTWPAYNNQACRYLLGLYEMDEHYAHPPHRAGPDTWVSAHIFVELVKGSSIRQMLEWTGLPRLMTTCPLGEHRGKAWVEVPEDYIRWIVSDKPRNMDADTVWNAQQALQDRARLRQNPDLASEDY